MYKRWLDENEVWAIFARTFISDFNSGPFAMASRSHHVLETGPFAVRAVALTSASKVSSLGLAVTLNTYGVAILEFIGVLVTFTGLHGLFNSKHYAISLPLFWLVRLEVGTDIVLLS